MQEHVQANNDDLNTSSRIQPHRGPALPPELERLDGISQGVRAFTELGAGAVYSRLSHTVKALEVLKGLIGSAELEPRYRHTLELLTLFHDIGHLPFSHTGEVAMARLGMPVDHDAFGAALVRDERTAVHRMCLNHGVSPEYMAQLMEPDSELKFPEAFLVKEIVDRLAYLSDDLKAQCFTDEARTRIAKVTQEANLNVQWHGDHFTITDPSFLGDILALRELKHSQLVLQPANLLAQELVVSELHRLIKCQIISEEQLYVMPEAEIVAAMSEKQRNRLLGRVENGFSFPVEWYPLNERMYKQMVWGIGELRRLHPALFSNAVFFSSMHSSKSSYIPAGIVDASPCVISPASSMRGLVGLAIPHEVDSLISDRIKTLTAGLLRQLTETQQLSLPRDGAA
jgi:hypothetical protein